MHLAGSRPSGGVSAGKGRFQVQPLKDILIESRVILLQ